MKTCIRVRPSRNQRALGNRDMFTIRVWKGPDVVERQRVYGLRAALKMAVQYAGEYGPGVKIHRPAQRLPLDVDELA